MCGIYGWFGKGSDSPRLRAMGSAIQHRGPDGFEQHQSGKISLGICRLAIVDKENGIQPFFNHDKSIATICNGEIYNHLEIRKELEACGHQFRTHSDTEILPFAWQEWGEAMLEKLNGMFSIAICDGEKLILARDRCGQKPLYLHEHEGVLHFGSEIRALLAAGIPAALNRAALPSYLINRYVPEPETLFRDITILPAGHFLTISSGSELKIQSWWKPRVSPKLDISEVEALSHLDSLTESSVMMALQGEEKIATYLSAGVDSSILLESIKKAGYQTTAFTAGFGIDSDEIHHAAQIAKENGMKHIPVTLRENDLGTLRQVVAQMELPVGDALILAFDKLAGVAAEHGFRVAIGGDGIDESMRGYSFQNHLSKMDALPSAALQPAALAIRHCPLPILDRFFPFPGSLGKEGRNKIADYLESFPSATPWQKSSGLRTLFTPAEANRLCIREVFQEPEIPEASTILDRQTLHLYESWMQDWAIIRQDRNNMARSIEYRMPYLDHRLVEFTLALPNGLKFHRGVNKYLWRKLSRTSAAERPKQPFHLPLEKFRYSKEFQTLLEECLNSSIIRARNLFDPKEVEALVSAANRGEFLALKKVTSLIIFELWMQTYID
ncbi:MAG: asparagine synthase (glutamine-hydrolyzing) [Akkermansiaceae bacterium]